MPKQAPRISDPNIEAKWVAAHGEAVTYTKAAQMLSVCNQTIINLVRKGKLQTTPEKRILVRPLAAYANQTPTQRRGDQHAMQLDAYRK